MGMALCGDEVTEAKVNPCELTPGGSFVRLVLLGLPDLQTLLHRPASFLEVPPSGGLVPPLASVVDHYCDATSWFPQSPESHLIRLTLYHGGGDV